MVREISTNLGDLIYEKLYQKIAHLDDKPDANPHTRRLWVLSNATCWRCDRQIALSKATIDHVIPKARGGSHNPKNLRLACQPCNQEHGSDAPDRPAPEIPTAGLLHYNRANRGAYNRRSVAELIRTYGDRCWLCGHRVTLDDAVMSRIVENGRRKGYTLANVRVAHARCQDKRTAMKNAWGTHLSRSRAEGPRGRLQARRRIHTLRYQPPVPVSWWRSLLRRIRAIVWRGTPRS